MAYTLETARKAASIEMDFDKNGAVDRAEISWYKLEKHSGYSVVLLYKNTVKLECVDFMCPRAKEIQRDYPQAERWNTYGFANFARLFAEAKGVSPFDQRYRYSTLKKRVVDMAKAELAHV